MKSVLVVDDDALVLAFLSRAIGRLGVDVRRTGSALEAVDALAESHDVGLVVSDINMPKMSGVELHAFMRNDANMQGIPIVLMTGGSGDVLPRDVILLRKPLSSVQIQCVVVMHLGGNCPVGHVVAEPTECGHVNVLRSHPPVAKGCMPDFCRDKCDTCLARNVNRTVS